MEDTRLEGSPSGEMHPGDPRPGAVPGLGQRGPGSPPQDVRRRDLLARGLRARGWLLGDSLPGDSRPEDTRPEDSHPQDSSRGERATERMCRPDSVGSGTGWRSAGHNRPTASTANATSIRLRTSRARLSNTSQAPRASTSGEAVGLSERRYAVRMSRTGQKSSADSRAIRSRERTPPARISGAGSLSERTAPSWSIARVNRSVICPSCRVVTCRSRALTRRQLMYTPASTTTPPMMAATVSRARRGPRTGLAGRRDRG